MDISRRKVNEGPREQKKRRSGPVLPLNQKVIPVLKMRKTLNVSKQYLLWTYYKPSLIKWSMLLFILILFSSCVSKPEPTEGVNLGSLNALICKPVIHQVSEGLTLSTEDYKISESSKAGCIRHYGADSCLKIFRKTKERTYEVICSKFYHVTEQSGI